MNALAILAALNKAKSELPPVTEPIMTTNVTETTVTNASETGALPVATSSNPTTDSAPAPINIDKTLLCQSCEENPAITFKYGQKLCQDCLDYEEKSLQESKERIRTNVATASETIITAQKIDTSVQVRTDVFNSETVAIQDIVRAIQADESIAKDDKAFAIAKVVTERLNHFKGVIFGLGEQIIAESNKQRAAQQYLNGVSNFLRQEQREKLKLLDINYTPKPVAPIKTPKGPKAIKKSTKIDKVELRNAALRLGVNEATLQMLCIAKGISVADAEIALRKSLEAAKATVQ